MKKYWSSSITKNSKSLILDQGIFTWNSPKKIAQSLKKSADASKNKKGSAYQSAMSMLNFYINRAGSNLSNDRLKILNKAKNELKILYNRN